MGLIDIDGLWWAVGFWIIPTSTDSHPRRRTFGPKPSGDCSFGSLSSRKLFWGAKIPGVLPCFHMFYHVFHVCFASPLLAYACFFVDMLFSWFFNSLYDFLPWLLQSMFLQLVTPWLLRPLSPQFPQQPQGPRGVHGHINSWERGMTWHMMWFMDRTW